MRVYPPRQAGAERNRQNRAARLTHDLATPAPAPCYCPACDRVLPGGMRLLHDLALHARYLGTACVVALLLGACTSPAPVVSVAPAALRAASAVPLPNGPGLYAAGSNVPSATLAAAALTAAEAIVPRLLTGAPVADWHTGTVGMLSIGISNTAWRWCAKTTTTSAPACTSNSFTKQAVGQVNLRVRIIAGAMGGQTVDKWIGPTNYDIVRSRMPAGGELQVQVVWFEMAHGGPADSLVEVDALVRDGGAALRAMAARYPNLKLIYMTSREYAGWATTPLNPEPYAYQSGLAARALILAQDAQRNGATADAVAGDLSQVPVLLWGPYLWNPAAPRSDFIADGTHPSAASITRQAAALLAFWQTDPTAVCWFTLARPACGP